MRWSGVVVLLGRCSSILGIDDFHTGATSDAPISDAVDGAPSDTPDAPIDAPAVLPGCYASLTNICFTPVPMGALSLVGNINTDTDSRCQIRTQAAGPPLCVIAAGTITVGAGMTIIVTGSRPLVLVGDQAITINGAVTVSSINAGTRGAGANVSSCTGAIGQTGGNEGGGGGAGATLGLIGARGGVGAGGAQPGMASSLVAISAIRGGCAGGRGGDGHAGSGPWAATRQGPSRCCPREWSGSKRTAGSTRPARVEAAVAVPSV